MKTNVILIFLVISTFIAGCQQPIANDTFIPKKGMIKVTILYPNDNWKNFDMDYYTNKHMPMVDSLLSPYIRHVSIDNGVAGGSPGAPIPYLAIGYLYFDTIADYENAFGPNGDKIVKDIPNYTNIQPVVQISEVIQ